MPQPPSSEHYAPLKRSLVESEKFHAVSHGAGKLFALLVCASDSQGVFPRRLILGKLYALALGEVSRDDVESWLEELSDVGLVESVSENGTGSPLVQISNFYAGPRPLQPRWNVSRALPVRNGSVTNYGEPLRTEETGREGKGYRRDREERESARAGARKGASAPAADAAPLPPRLRREPSSRSIRPDNPALRVELEDRFGPHQAEELYPLLGPYQEARLSIHGTSPWTLASWRAQLTALAKVHPQRRSEFLEAATAAPWRGFSRAASDSAWHALRAETHVNGRPVDDRRSGLLDELAAIARGKEPRRSN